MIQRDLPKPKEGTERLVGEISQQSCRAKSASVKSFQKPRRLQNASAQRRPITNQLVPDR
jgi:hypothetical protein